MHASRCCCTTLPLCIACSAAQRQCSHVLHHPSADASLASFALQEESMTALSL